MRTKLALRLATIAAVLAGASLDNRAAAQERQPELKKLRVLMVIDTYAPRLKDVVQRDKEHMQEFLKEGIPPDRYDVGYIEGKNATPTKILDYYANLKTGPDEALLFFYVGHGGMTESDHFLTLEADGQSPNTFEGIRYYMLARKAIVNSMRNNKPGLIVLLTACCSAYLPDRADNTVGALPPKTVVAKEIKPVIRSLFFEHRGIVDITAAPPGESALGNGTRGTIFTNNFVNLALQDDLSKYKTSGDFVTWKAFHARLKDQMNASAMMIKRAEEEAKKAGKLDKVQPELDVQLAYDFQLADEGKVPRPKWRFGVVVDTHDGRGLKIQSVFPDTPAAKAGLREGDVILSMNGRALESTYDFTRSIADSDGKLKIEVSTARTGKTETLSVTLDKLQ